MHIVYLADRPEHTPTLARWHYEEWSHLHAVDSVERRVVEFEEHMGRRRVPTTFVALEGDEPVGSASLVVCDMDTRADLTPWLASVFVPGSHRGRGIGSALVIRAMKEAETIGVPALYLFTPDRESLYARLGWSVIERTTYRGISVVVMQYTFSDGSEAPPV